MNIYKTPSIRTRLHKLRSLALSPFQLQRHRRCAWRR